jgi:hypothetical protein
MRIDEVEIQHAVDVVAMVRKGTAGQISELISEILK